MRYVQPKFSGIFVSLIFIFFASGCSRCSAPESAGKGNWKNDLVQNYCGPALSNLAQGIPDGVEPIVERVNPYPALPDYRMFPDVSATHHNAKMLFKLAKCVHEKCVNPDSKRVRKTRMPMPVGCENTKANFLFKSMLEVANSCGGPRYLKARMAQTLQSVYLENEGQPLQVCEGLLKGEDIVAEAMGLPAPLTQGSVVASDAFFPFADGLITAAEAGATALIQPGGSMRDDEVIAAANEAGLAMVFTGMRHFRH